MKRLWGKSTEGLSVDDHRNALRNALHSSAVDFLKQKHRDWFDENNPDIQSLSRLHQAYIIYVGDKSSQSLKDSYIYLKREVQACLRAMKNWWWKDLSDELQAAYEEKETKSFYSALKAVYGPISHGSSPLYATDGQTLIKDKAGILNCWAEHFNSV